MKTGVYVAGKYQVQTTKGKISPWKETDIELGDRIETINGIRIDNNEQLLKYLSTCQSDSVQLVLLRDSKKLIPKLMLLKIKTMNHP